MADLEEKIPKNRLKHRDFVPDNHEKEGQKQLNELRKEEGKIEQDKLANARRREREKPLKTTLFWRVSGSMEGS